MAISYLKLLSDSDYLLLIICLFCLFYLVLWVTTLFRNFIQYARDFLSTIQSFREGGSVMILDYTRTMHTHTHVYYGHVSCYILYYHTRTHMWYTIINGGHETVWYLMGTYFNGTYYTMINGYIYIISGIFLLYYIL